MGVTVVTAGEENRLRSFHGSIGQSVSGLSNKTRKRCDAKDTRAHFYIFFAQTRHTDRHGCLLFHCQLLDYRRTLDVAASLHRRVCVLSWNRPIGPSHVTHSSFPESDSINNAGENEEINNIL